MIYGLDLFSGIGGIGLALKPWVRTIAYCEQDRYAQGVLLSRMQSGDIDRAPIFTNVQNLRGENFRTKPEIIFGGFPCQDISVAGNGKGMDGQRSGLFYEIVRLAEEIKPVFIFLENVPAIRTRGLDVVLKELAAIGYDCRWTTISAASVGAPHKRDRWFLLAHSNGKRKRLQQIKTQERKNKTVSFYDGKKESLADSDSVRELSKQREHDRSGYSGKNFSDTNGERLSNALRGGHEEKHSEPSDNFLRDFWAIEPNVGRVVNGLPNRVDRIKCLGNSVVPFQVRTAFKKTFGGRL